MLLWLAWRAATSERPERARARQQALGFTAMAAQGALVAWAITRQQTPATGLVPVAWNSPGVLLAGLPFLMIGIAAIARVAIRSGPPVVKLVTAWALVAIGAYALRAGMARGLFG